MDFVIREENPQDHAAVFDLIQQAFAGEELSDHREHFLVERLRQSTAFVPELSLVAAIEDYIIGYLLLIKVNVGEPPTPLLALAPVSVLPEFQGQGVGGQLIREAHDRAAVMGFPGIVLLGHADYYSRFGYRPAHEYGIELPYKAPPENCLALELWPGALDRAQGEVVYPAAFFE